jgi:demethylmenaquinone methyltransferase/2-methoxy-6-polyprenyl-1,4-benzoquinol methylase
MSEQAKTVVPYKGEDSAKKEQVAKMFDKISKKYDFLNHFLSMGIDILWRKKSIRILKKYPIEHLLDVATGTGDFALEALALSPKKIYGVDISEGMLAVGKEKIKKLGKDNIITLEKGDSENLRFEDNTFDAVIVAFGVRNFENLSKGIEEIRRVLKPNGVLLVLEFSQPRVFPFKQLYNFYFNNVLPTIGKMVSKDDSAYTYLPESVKAFPSSEKFLELLQKVGFKNTKWHSLTLGISSIYIGEK